MLSRHIFSISLALVFGLAAGATPARAVGSVLYAAPVITEGDMTGTGMNKNGSPRPFDLTLHATDPDAGDPLTWSIGAGAFHTCGLKSDGMLACWGDNGYGQATPPAGTFTQVSAGNWHTCGLKSDGTLACWGRNDYGQSTPPGGTFIQVSAGAWHACGLKSDGTIACWGDDEYGRSTPPVGTFTQVSAGGFHTCGLKSDGTLACWGYNSDGQSTPPAGTFTQVSAGAYHTCGLKSDGTPACWGNNHSGQSTPPAGTFTQVSAGADHTCGLKSDGTLACWGYNDSGQSTPPAGTFTQVSAGYDHTCGLKSDGTIACWGANGSGQLNPWPEISEGDSVEVTMSEDGSPTPFDLTLHAWDWNDATLAWSISAPATNGTATASGSGTFKAISYTPNLNYNGTDSFVVQVSDGTAADSITVNVTINPVNDPPVITEGASTSVTMDEDGSPVTFDLTLHATDADGDTLTWSVSTPAEHGAATANGTGASKSVGYVPATDYNGSDSFEVQASDGNGGTDTITVNVTINPVNDGPPAITEGDSTSVTMDEDGSPVAFDLTLHATDPDAGDTLTWSISAPAGHGTASASGSGTSKAISYTPDLNYNGADSFIVQVSDGATADTITVNVTINPVNDDPPVITEGASTSVTMDENGSPVAFDLTLHATDPDAGDTLTWSISAPATNGTASVSGTGTSKSIGYVPATNFNGSDSFDVQVSDGNSGTDTITVNVTINPVNDPPVITEGDLTGTGINKNGTPRTFDLTLHATDADNDSLTWSINAPAGHGTASANGSGTSKAVGYTPAADYTGWDSFEVQVDDGNGGTDTITVNVNIYEVDRISTGGYHTCGVKSDGTIACWGGNSYGQSTPPTGTFTQVSTGRDHTCGLKSDGTLACWGYNGYGQSTPPVGTFTQVSAGWDHTCGLKSDGTLACWGDNGYGQSTPPAGTFTQVSAGCIHTCGLKSDGTLVCWGYNYFGESTPPAGTFTQVSAGSYHTCGLKSDGTIACWGDNAYSQSTPLAGMFTQVRAGWSHTCGLKSDGTIACWGDNSYGQSTPPAGIFTQIGATGRYHTCGLKSDGTLACWGWNYYGQLNPRPEISEGDSVAVTMSEDGSPVAFDLTLHAWDWNDATLTWSSSTASHGTATASGTGTLKAISYTPNLNYNGADSFIVQVSDGAAADSITVNVTINPVNDDPPVITEGDSTSVTMDEDGSPVAFDLTLHATDPDADDTLTWSISSAALHGPATASGTGTSKAINYTPNLNYNGMDSFVVQVSDGVTADSITVNVTINPVNDPPVITEGASTGTGMNTNGTPRTFNLTLHATDVEGDTFTWSISSAASHGTATVSGSGTSKAIGYTPAADYTGWDSFVVQVDDGNGGTDTITVNVNIYEVDRIGAGWAHTCGLKSDGTLACWGWNTYGQSIPPAGTFTQVSGGTYHTCGLKSDGTLSCWGRNDYGQSTPPAGTFTQVSAGDTHTCGLKSDGTLACWGNNSSGQSTPPAGTFTLVSAGDYHTCGLKSDGTLACWGWNTYGQSIPPAGTFIQVSAGYRHTCGLNGDGTLTCWGYDGYGQSSPPAGIFAQVSVGTWHSCGLKSDGTLACWGDNDYGQSTPPAGTFTQISAGAYHNCGLKSDGRLACWGDNADGQLNPRPEINEGDSMGVTMSEDNSPTPFDLTLHAWDWNDATLTWSISAPATNGTATASGSGTSKAISYTPNLNYNGADSFIVQVSDGAAADSITVNVTINPVNDPPVITEGDSTSVTMDEDGSPVAFDLTLHATDADGDTLTWSVSSPAGHGTASASGTGASKSVGYVPATDYNGSDSFEVQVSDGAAADSITVNVTINPVNAPPTDISLSASSVTENLPAGTTVGTLSTTDPDAGDTHTYSFCSGAEDGSFTITGDTLLTDEVFDYETKNSYSICIRSTDNGDLFFDKTFPITILDAYEGPLFSAPQATGLGDCSSWENACTLQTALASATSGDQIWAQMGVHTPTTTADRTISFVLKSGVAVYGGFNGTETLLSQRDWQANVTILSGDIGTPSDATDNSYHVVTGGGTDSTAVLDGFTVTAGNANAAYPNNYGGGMYNDSSSPTLANVTFSGNTASQGGGGMFNDSSSPTLTNVTFSGNTASWGGGGMYNTDSSSPSLTNVTFSSNSATVGGGMLNYTNSNPTLTNVTFSANYGGGMLNADYSMPNLTNVTFSGNYGGGMSNTNGGNPGNRNPTIKDSIFWGNGTEIDNYNSTPVIDDSLIQGGCPAGATCNANILNADPLLGALANNGGFTQTMALSAGSPAMDAGNNATCAATDQRGVTRPQDGDNNGTAICDMGAFEVVDAPPVVTSIVRSSANPTSAASVDFTVTFSEAVTGVDSSAPFNDFFLTTTGVTGASISSVTGSGDTYTVTVDTGTGAGTIRLDVLDDDTIIDTAGNPLDGGYTNGEVYTIVMCYTLTKTSNPNEDGVVTASPMPDCNGGTQYTDGTQVELTAVANIGYVFANWSGDASGTTNPVSVTMDADKSVTANFTLNTYTLSVNKAGTGSGTVTSDPAGINCGSDCSETYDYNTSVTLTTTASTGSTFTGWSGAGCSGTDICTVTMDADKSVTATFTLNTYTLSVNKAGTGSGTVTSDPAGIDCGTDCSETYDYNTSVTLTATADTGSTFTGWSGAGCSGTGTCTVTMDTDKSVTATFTLNTYTLSVNKAGTGSGTVTSDPAGIDCGSDCSETYDYDTSVTLTATADTGSTFTGWSGAGCFGTDICTVTMDAAKSVTATFTLNTYTLSVNKAGTGSGTVISDPAGIDCGSDCSETYDYDTSVTLTATADSGSTFIGWSGDPDCSDGVVTMNASKSCTATFNLLAPPAPTNVQASDGTYTNKVRVTWDASSGAISYKVYRATSATGTTSLLGSPTGTTFDDTTATTGVTYYYWVKACKGANCSGFSAYDTGWRNFLPPTNAQASDGTYTDKVQVTWNAASGATSHQVYRATSAAGAKTLLGSPTGTQFNDTSATPGITYYYWVKACNGTNCSSFSAYDTGWRKPTAPTNVQASDGTYTDKVQVSWNASSGTTSYKVYRAASATGTKSLLGSPTGTSFNDTTATPGITYYYWVMACRSSRCSSNSAYNTGWRKLSPPTGVTASDGTYTNKVRVTWNPSSGATSYKVYRAASATGTKNLRGSPTGTSFNDTAATPSITYYYWVKACNGANCSGYSAYNTGWRRPSP